ncbi:SPFH domain-containing protein [Nonomuraea sp. NPDC049141]|uniref:SPFH domain-containing protein n=1 Tax=Nonomuraea sp. NPDC049141 TaxID=3155500 RepID=UPI0033F386AB
MALFAKIRGELAGTDAQFRTEEVEGYLRQMIVGRLAHAMSTANVPVLDMAANQHAMGQQLAEVLTADLAGVGISVPNFTFENISLPPEVEEALDKRSQMGILGDLGQYAKFQAANALENSGGIGEGMGLGMGIAAGQQMAAALKPEQPAQQGPPPPAPSASTPTTPSSPSHAYGRRPRTSSPARAATPAPRATRSPSSASSAAPPWSPTPRPTRRSPRKRCSRSPSTATAPGSTSAAG